MALKFCMYTNQGKSNHFTKCEEVAVIGGRSYDVISVGRCRNVAFLLFLATASILQTFETFDFLQEYVL